jgi:predicted permease
MRDLRYAARQLWKSPGFTLTVLVTLGLCIGANTAIYSVVDAVLLRAAPYPHPEQLGMVAYTARSSRGEYTGAGQNGAMWEAVRDNATTVEAAAFSGGGQGVNLFADGAVLFVRQGRVSAGFFHVLGIAPLIGREFSRAEDTASGAPVAILSYGLWQRLFRGDGGAIGKAILLKGEPHTVIGVMPQDFRTESPADLWTPLRPSRTGEGRGINYGIVARLKPGVTIAAANAQLDAIEQPLLVAMRFREGSEVHAHLTPLQTGLTSGFRNSLLVMWGAVALVLLIGCVNIAGLMLARAATRSREVATRMAIGAGRGAIVRQLLTESLLLALAGGALGVLVGKLALRGLAALGAQGFNMWNPVELNLRVLAATLLLTLMTSLLFGLAPAIATTRVDLRSILVEGGRGLSGGKRRWSRQALVAGEVALSVVLLVGAGLLLRTFAYLQGLNPGFDPRHVMTAQLSLQDARYRKSAQVNRLFDESLDRIRKLPGVEAAAVGLSLPYEPPLNDSFRIPGGDAAASEFVSVTPGFFETLRIPLLAGAYFSDSDAASTPVAIVNEAFRRRYLRSREAVGSEIFTGKEKRRIVGVVGNIQQGSRLGNYGPLATMPTIYIPMSQTSDAFQQLVNTWFSPHWIVRTNLAPDAIARAMQREMQAIDPQLPFNGFHLMEEVQFRALKQQRYQAAIFSAMAGLALILAALGVYGMIAHAVTERTREMGIRMALGATLAQTVLALIRPALQLAAMGVVAGAIAARFASALLGSLLWGVRTTDPVTFAAVSATLLVVALGASLLPALRLSQLDPAVTLRSD